MYTHVQQRMRVRTPVAFATVVSNISVSECDLCTLSVCFVHCFVHSECVRTPGAFTTGVVSLSTLAYASSECVLCTLSV